MEHAQYKRRENEILVHHRESSSNRKLLRSFRPAAAFDVGNPCFDIILE
jgi:hypothetical protein